MPDYGKAAFDLSNKINGKIEVLQGIGTLSKSFGRVAPEANDTGRLQRAIDSTPNGKKLILTEPYYDISSTLNGVTGLSIEGLGVKETIINNSGTGYAISISGTGVFDAKRYTAIKNLTIQGTASAAGGIKLAFNGEFFEIDKVRILGHINGIGIDLPDSFSGIIKNVHISQCINSTGIRMYGNTASTGQATFMNVVVAYSKYGVELGEAYNTTTAQIIDSVNFIGCIFQHCSASSVRIGANVRNSKFQTCHFERGLDESATAIGLEIAGQTAIQIDVDTCWFYDFNKAIKLDKATKCTGRNINFQDCQYGIEFTTNATDNTFQNIRFANPTITLIQGVVYAGSNNRVFETRDIITSDAIRYVDNVVVGYNTPISNINYETLTGSTFLLDSSLYKYPSGKTAKFKIRAELGSATSGDVIFCLVYNATNATNLIEFSSTVASDGRLMFESPLTDFPVGVKWCNIQMKNSTTGTRSFTPRRVMLIVEFV